MQTFFVRWFLLAMALLMGWALPSAKVATGVQPPTAPAARNWVALPVAADAKPGASVTCQSQESADLPTGDVVAGQWRCDGTGTWSVTPATDIYFQVLDGQAQLTLRQKTFVLKPGDAFSVREGEPVSFSLAGGLRLTYLQHDTGRLVRWYRMLRG